MGARAIKTNVRAIVAYEPGSNFIFPNDEVPPPMPSSSGPLEAVGMPLPEFMKLTKIPIIIFYGDNIPERPSANPGQDQWRVSPAMARLWRDTVNRRSGSVLIETYARTIAATVASWKVMKEPSAKHQVQFCTEIKFGRPRNPILVLYKSLF